MGLWCKPSSSLLLLLTVFIGLSYVLLAIGLVHHKNVRANEKQRQQQPPRVGRAIQQQQQQQLHTLFPHVDVMRLRPKADADTVTKMKAMEAKRQDLYVRLLRKRGQVVALAGGGEAIVSYPHAPVTMPNVIKYRSYGNWTDREKIWANL